MWKGLPAPVIVEENNFMKHISEYILSEGASRFSNPRKKYIDKIYRNAS